MKFSTGELINGDCLEVMKSIPDKSVDMILCDLPYGTTQCSWDVIIPFEPLWEQYWRITKENAAVVLTCTQPFTSYLITSNIKQYKYSWIWDKVNKFTGALNANRMPMLDYEEVAVFYRKQCVYNKQFRDGSYITRHSTGNRNTKTVGQSDFQPDVGRRVEGLNPKRILSIPSHKTTGVIHPTQKPVELFEYLIKTYTNEGDKVLDNCSGSGTTAVAAIQTNRKWICIEKDEEYYRKSCERISKIREDILTYEG